VGKFCIDWSWCAVSWATKLGLKKESNDWAGRQNFRLGFGLGLGSVLDSEISTVVAPSSIAQLACRSDYWLPWKMVGVYLRPIWVGFYMPTLCKHICFTFQAPPCVLFCHCLSSFQRCQHAESVRGGISGVRVVRGNELRFGRIAGSHLHGCDGFRNGMLLSADDLPGLQHMWGASSLRSADSDVPDHGADFCLHVFVSCLCGWYAYSGHTFVATARRVLKELPSSLVISRVQEWTEKWTVRTMSAT